MPNCRVGAAPCPEELERLAGRLPPNLRLGTSSWSFPGWAGLVYDRLFSAGQLARGGLGAYARHPLLRAVGIDRTYYAPLPTEVFADYAAQVPEDFRFVVKAPSICVAPRELPDPRSNPNPHWLDADFATRSGIEPCVAGLGPRLGAIVFQFPPQGSEITREPARFSERLAGFLSALPRGPVYGVELRDSALFSSDHGRLLDALGIAHVFSVHPRMPTLAAQYQALGLAPSGPLLVRWMLGGRLSYAEARQKYAPFTRLVDEDPGTREVLANLCVDYAAAGREVLVIVNNKAEGSAPRSAFKLAASIVERSR